MQDDKPFVNAPVITATAWLFWCLLHSLLITNSLTAYLRRLLGRRYAFFRIFYNLFSLLSAAAVFFLQVRLPRQLLWSWHGEWRILQGALLLYAFFMLAAGARVYDLSAFSGISQIRSYRRGTTAAGMPFTCKGILQVVRHPWYSGGLAFLWGVGHISDVSLPAKVVLSAYLVIGAMLEERKLRAALGDAYAAYQRRVPMFFPWKGFRR